MNGFWQKEFGPIKLILLNTKKKQEKNILIDTNVLIYYLQNEKGIVEYLEKWQKDNLPLFMSVISITEILSYSKLEEKEIIVIKNFLDKFIKISIDEKISQYAAELRRKYKIKIGDALIASTAILYNQQLITRDKKDFNKIKELYLLFV